jgi:predicted transcriptional regulator
MENISTMVASMHYELDIKRVRKATGKSVREIAYWMGVSQSTIYRIESGDIDASATQIADMAQLLSCTPGDLFVIKFADDANNA